MSQTRTIETPTGATITVTREPPPARPPRETPAPLAVATSQVLKLRQPIRTHFAFTSPQVAQGTLWTDTLFLAANTAQTYTFPTDSFGVTPNFFRITSTGLAYINWQGAAAAVPAANILNGTAPQMIAPNIPYIVAPPQPVAPSVSPTSTSFSIVAGAAATVCIEAYD